MSALDCVVAGAGVIGLAVARALARRGREVVVLERAEAIGTGVSSRSSEVIHAGIYYPTGSLKARLCVAGRDMLYRYCEARAVPHARIGKLIVATTPDEVAVLDGYRHQAEANGAGRLHAVDRRTLALWEPALRAEAALLSPRTGIVDSHALMLALQADLEAAGGVVVFASQVLGGAADDAGIRLRLADGDFRCRSFVNAAGLDALPLAQRFGAAADRGLPQARYARGHYFAYSGAQPFRRLVYPVAQPGGLGVHLTLDLGGGARFGPDVAWCDSPDLTFDCSRKSDFVAAIRRYYPALEADRLQPAYVGVRPKLSGPGEAAADFLVLGPGPHGAVHLLGFESPGLTAALAVAEHVAEALA